MCDEILLFNGVDVGIKKVVFLMDFKQQYLPLVESVHTKFKPEWLDF
jgi:hypothetical protein